jgi:thiosulfate reductase cytochrome b subunit
MATAAPKSAKQIHPAWVRITHWINAFAILLMVTSGWRIYNASPLFDFVFPREITIGGWLAGALMWHFAAMWLLMINGLVYLFLGFYTGRFKRKLLPLSLSGLIRDIRDALTLKLGHEDLSVYNMVQRVLYIGVLVAGVVIVLSGFAIWKPVQFQELAAVMGGYEGARLVHFLAMAAIAGFFLVHVTVAVLVPKSIHAMIAGK